MKPKTNQDLRKAERLKSLIGPSENLEKLELRHRDGGCNDKDGDEDDSEDFDDPSLPLELDMDLDEVWEWSDPDPDCDMVEFIKYR